MAFDAFLLFKEPGTAAYPLKGETQDAGFTNAFEISEFSFGAENTINISSATTGAGAGKATFKEFTVKKMVDNASPKLLVTLGMGGHYKKVQLFLRKAGAEKGKTGAAYLTFAFGMVAVKSLEWSGSSGDDVPTETVIFEYGELQVGYKPQKEDGSLGALEAGSWSKIYNSEKTKLIAEDDVKTGKP